jgi:hypothetical protein
MSDRMSQELRIYWTSVEFRLKETHMEFNKLKGGFVYAFLKCRDSEEALDRFKAELDQYNLVPFDFEFIKPYEVIEWDNDKDTKHYKEILKKASKREKVILDSFYMYENE